MVINAARSVVCSLPVAVCGKSRTQGFVYINASLCCHCHDNLPASVSYRNQSVTNVVILVIDWFSPHLSWAMVVTGKKKKKRSAGLKLLSLATNSETVTRSKIRSRRNGYYVMQHPDPHADSGIDSSNGNMDPDSPENKPQFKSYPSAADRYKSSTFKLAIHVGEELVAVHGPADAPAALGASGSLTGRPRTEAARVCGGQKEAGLLGSDDGVPTGRKSVMERSYSKMSSRTRTQKRGMSASKRRRRRDQEGTQNNATIPSQHSQGNQQNTPVTPILTATASARITSNKINNGLGTHDAEHEQGKTLVHLTDGHQEGPCSPVVFIADNHADDGDNDDGGDNDDRLGRQTLPVTPPSAPGHDRVRDGPLGVLPDSTAKETEWNAVKTISEDDETSRRELQQAGKKRTKLRRRLKQVTSSLTSPHLDAAVERYETASRIANGPPDTELLMDFRRLFRQEVTRLRFEVDSFRHFCSKQMVKEAEKLTNRPQLDIDHGINRTETATQTLQEIEITINVAEVKQRENDLDSRTRDLEEYEKEILEVESMLNQRQAICERRQNALLALDEELQILREDLIEKKEDIKHEGDSAEERAKKNWNFIKRHLTDKQAMLEATIQRYKTQIASANASLAAKDTLIAHLQKQVKERREQARAGEERVRRLEAKLVLANQQRHLLTFNKDAGPDIPDSPAPSARTSSKKRVTMHPSVTSRSDSSSALLSPGTTRSQGAESRLAVHVDVVKGSVAAGFPVAGEAVTTSQNRAQSEAAKGDDENAGNDDETSPSPQPRPRRQSIHHPDLSPDVLQALRRHKLAAQSAGGGRSEREGDRPRSAVGGRRGASLRDHSRSSSQSAGVAFRRGRYNRARSLSHLPNSSSNTTTTSTLAEGSNSTSAACVIL